MVRIHSMYSRSIPTLQSPAIVDAALTQNTWYTVLDTTPNCRIMSILLNQDTAGEDIEGKMTIDGLTILCNVTVVAGTNYYIVTTTDVDATAGINNGIFQWYGTYPTRAFLIDCRSFKLEIRKTTAAGANNTACKVIYGTW